MVIGTSKIKISYKFLILTRHHGTWKSASMTWPAGALLFTPEGNARTAGYRSFDSRARGVPTAQRSKTLLRVYLKSAPHLIFQ